VSIPQFEQSLKKKVTLEEVKIYFEDKTLSPEAMHKLKGLHLRMDEVNSTLTDFRRD